MHGSISPQFERLFITDAGLETDLIFNHGLDIPYFASITLMTTAEGRDSLRRYFRDFIDLAEKTGTGCLLETATWRASSDWAARLAMTEAELDRLNTAAVELLHRLREREANRATQVLISGCIGPRGDGYDPGLSMTAEAAESYHLRQARALATGKPDLLTAMTMNNVPEAIGIAKAGRAVGLPTVISFTLETDGRLPTGETLGDAIEAVDRATGGYPAHFMINCAHPSHFAREIEEGGAWTDRVRGIRANASRCSHAELDAMTDLGIGDPQELAQQYLMLRRIMPHLTVLGGCCGTDLRHVSQIAKTCAGHPAELAA